jgi:uncharacterized protein
MSYIMTFSRKKFYPFQPITEDINIADISHALSNLCRFVGHTEDFYSVAQHSVIVSEILASQGFASDIQFAGLMHDATEAYLGDIATPIKVKLDTYNLAEDHLAEAIARKFNIDWDLSTIKAVGRADIIAFHSEARDLMGNPQEWQERDTYEVISERILPLNPREARLFFLNRFDMLRKRL